ncbi:hypothetical protein BC830DRAFT_1165333 [Chytriomyces sp. MP71]|nr:hypothetical protein BC830DRAFT_1165333 [Chytriomyces sp. MP71]
MKISQLLDGIDDSSGAAHEAVEWESKAELQSGSRHLVITTVTEASTNTAIQPLSQSTSYETFYHDTHRVTVHQARPSFNQVRGHPLTRDPTPASWCGESVYKYYSAHKHSQYPQGSQYLQGIRTTEQIRAATSHFIPSPHTDTSYSLNNLANLTFFGPAERQMLTPSTRSHLQIVGGSTHHNGGMLIAPRHIFVHNTKLHRQQYAQTSLHLGDSVACHVGFEPPHPIEHSCPTSHCFSPSTSQVPDHTMALKQYISITASCRNNLADLIAADPDRRYICPMYGQPKAKRWKYGNLSYIYGNVSYIGMDADDLTCRARFRRRQEMERHIMSVHGSEEDKVWVCPGAPGGSGPCGRRFSRVPAVFMSNSDGGSSSANGAQRRSSICLRMGASGGSGMASFAFDLDDRDGSLFFEAAQCISDAREY